MYVRITHVLNLQSPHTTNPIPEPLGLIKRRINL
jgi:hypothetical protein